VSEQPEPVSIKALFARVLEEAGIKADAKQLRAAERSLIKGIVEMLVADGYTMRLCAECLGVSESTLKSWRKRDADWSTALDSRREETRRWLLAELRENLRTGGKAAGQAANILANLWFKELRESKVTAEVSNVPTPGETRWKVLEFANRKG
jgi:hypothetical protein